MGSVRDEADRGKEPQACGAGAPGEPAGTSLPSGPSEQLPLLLTLFIQRRGQKWASSLVLSIPVYVTF